MSRTLVTGGAGFIGSHVVRELLARGRAVRVMVRPGEDTRNLDGLDVERVPGDVTEPASLERAVQGCARVFHLAAIYAIWLPEPRRMFDVNVTGTQNLLFACQRAGVERVVHTSSIAALGLLPDRPSDEETPFNQVRLANDYVLSKWLSEEVALGFARQGLPVVITNPAFPFGARDVGPTPTGKLLLDVVKGRFPGYFEAGFNVVDVEDVARGHLLAEEKGQPGRRYLLSGTNMSMKDFMQLVARVAGVRPRLRRVPAQLAVWYGDWLDRRAEKVQRPPLLSGRTLRYALQNLHYDNSRTRAELGLALTPIEDSIRRALEWFRANGQLRG